MEPLGVRRADFEYRCPNESRDQGLVAADVLGHTEYRGEPIRCSL